MSRSALHAAAPPSDLDVVPCDVAWGDEYEGYQPGSLPGHRGRCTFHRSLEPWTPAVREGSDDVHVVRTFLICMPVLACFLLISSHSALSRRRLSLAIAPSAPYDTTYPSLWLPR